MLIYFCVGPSTLMSKSVLIQGPPPISSPTGCAQPFKKNRWIVLIPCGVYTCRIWSVPFSVVVSFLVSLLALVCVHFFWIAYFVNVSPSFRTWWGCQLTIISSITWSTIFFSPPSSRFFSGQPDFLPIVGPPYFLILQVHPKQCSLRSIFWRASWSPCLFCFFSSSVEQYTIQSLQQYVQIILPVINGHPAWYSWTETAQLTCPLR